MVTLLAAIFVLFGCNEDPQQVREIIIQKAGENEETRILNDHEEVEALETLLNKNKWYMSNGDYMGADYTFIMDGVDYNIHIHNGDNSIEIVRITSEGKKERTYLLYEQAETFFKLITGKTMGD